MTKRTSLPIIITAMLLFMGCSQETANNAAIAGVERVVKEVAISSGTPVTMADLSISGMSCEMMCGGAIKKALAKLGVEGTEIKMSEDDESPDHAIVTYDESKVTDAQMIDAIQALYDGQYKVMAVTVTKQVKGAGSSAGKKEGVKEEKGVNAYSASEVVLPSIVAILMRILR